jgi:hypothetical protein
VLPLPLNIPRVRTAAPAHRIGFRIFDFFMAQRVAQSRKTPRPFPLYSDQLICPAVGVHTASTKGEDAAKNCSDERCELAVFVTKRSDRPLHLLRFISRVLGVTPPSDLDERDGLPHLLKLPPFGTTPA